MNDSLITLALILIKIGFVCSVCRPLENAVTERVKFSDRSKALGIHGAKDLCVLDSVR